MRAFAELLDRLSLTASRNAKLVLLRDYLRATPDPDRGWALASLTGDLSFDSAKPAMIRKAVLAGAPSAIEVGDRRAAIGEAIAMARAGDIVLVAGKGHEQGQIIGDQVLPFDDVTVAGECAA